MTIKRRPNRLHHTAYTSKDLEATRAFYEDVIGLPLIATYTEKDVLFGKEREYCHVFFELADGSALAFFQFAHKEDEAEFSPPMPESPFHHIALHVDPATQAELEARIRDAGMREPDTYVLEHGYCRSVYVKDPNGMILEFTLDTPEAVTPEVDGPRRAAARAELARWLAGDLRNNNPYRHAA
ncbi:MAG: VOC family protein [Sandarakinorhabdus sp.]|nr:VOC family protein [Sandarakinorhabdus sp.]